MKSLFRKKSVNTMLAQKKELKRTLSLIDLIFLGVGCVIGTGIFVITGVVAAESAGPAIIISFILSGVACVLVALCYAEFSSAVPISGSVYTYTYATLGEVFAFLIGWDLMLEYVLAISAVATGWSAYFQSLIAGFGIHIPKLLSSAPGAGPGGIVNLPAVIIILVITAIVSKGVKESTRFNNIMVIIKLIVILIFICAGIGYVKPENWTPFMPFGFQGVVTSAATVFFAYIGFDVIATASEEVKRPQRDMPIGIITSLAICTLLYMAVSLVLTGMIPYVHLDVADPVSFALKFVGEDRLAGLISVGAVIGITTVLLALVYAQVRLSYAMARDGLLPKLLSKVHRTYKTPFTNTWLTGFVAAGIAGFVDLTTLAHLVNMGTLAAFTLVSLAIIVLRRKHPELKPAFRVPFVPVLPAVGALLCIYLSISLPGVTWISFVIWIAVGTAVYFLYSKRHSHLNKEKSH
ncbi:amino acid/polyamine/organocation transporter (APC superfamily) [Scopulibacillus darangshiensis]|uniref:Amino acid/polyamine/organocation transporter (APC superfamily) n=1 Tax=Scopulibacillus darangshiensis TaxID=442528 RepID=A0A4R2NGI6_9BACL|nr:amino acid permease [Scopulibacillus darangshiensis]TCP20332.1 amino acid/polyamine/organocation transporter (APC superfamily) [Scopulibacillus darangshiensis]